MRISDWSSDVCSSDLTDRIGLASPATTSLPGVEAMDAELNTDWSAAGDAELADVIALRRAINAEPELGLHCPPTTEKLKAEIADRSEEHTSELQSLMRTSYAVTRLQKKKT